MKVVAHPFLVAVALGALGPAALTDVRADEMLQLSHGEELEHTHFELEEESSGEEDSSVV